MSGTVKDEAYHRLCEVAAAVADISANNPGRNGRGPDSLRFCVLPRAIRMRRI